MKEYLRPWKITTLLAGICLLVAGALYFKRPDWDIGVSVLRQWGLNAWPNVLITVVLMCVTIYYAWQREYLPVGLFSTRVDNAFTEILDARFGKIK